MRRRTALCATLAAALLGLAPVTVVSVTSSPAQAVPGVLVIDDGHVDVGPYLDGDEMAWKVKYHQGNGEVFRDLSDTVFRVGPEGYLRVPAQGTGGRDWEATAYRNAWIHQLPSTATPNLLWLGFDNTPIAAVGRQYGIVVEGVSGPGDVMLEGDGSGRPFFTTRASMPHTFTQYGHFHMTWGFTQPGKYCIAVRAKARRAGTAQPIEAIGEITVVTHEIDASTVVPCDADDTPRPQATPVRPAQGAVGGAPFVAQTGLYNDADYFDLVPRLDGDELDVSLVRTSVRDSGSEYRPEDVIFYQRFSLPEPYPSAPWQQPDAASPAYLLGTERLALGTDMVDLEDDDLVGDLTWRLAEVDGPGEVSFDTVTDRRDGYPMLSSLPGWETPEADLWAGHRLNGLWSFTEPGTYCVTMEWEGEAAGGGALYDDMDLTFVIDDPALPPTDPTTVTPCARASGDAERVVLDQGHLDLGLRLLDGTFDLSARDDSASPATFRALSGVVGHATSLTKQVVPDDPAYSFLGEPGGPAWVLPQTQSFDVLWPGWSTESLPAQDVVGPVQWTLDRVRGPGWFTLWQETGFGPEVLLDSGDGAPDTMPVPLGTHAHANWGFSAPGRYCLDFTVRASNPAGRPLADSGTFMVQVGGPTPALVVDDDCADQTVGRPIATSIGAHAVKQVYGRPADVVVQVSPNATGSVRLTVGSHTVTETLTGGRATLSLPARALLPGSRAITLTYDGVPGQFKPSLTTVAVRVDKAKSKVKVKPVDTTVHRGGTAVLKVTVTGQGVVPTGKMKVMLGGRSMTVRLDSKGRATVRIALGRLPAGKQPITATYLGDDFVSRGKARSRVTIVP